MSYWGSRHLIAALRIWKDVGEQDVNELIYIMNESKLREMMKIYTVSKQVNKKAEKNFLKFSSQYFKVHKNEMTPDFLNEIN